MGHQEGFSGFVSKQLVQAPRGVLACNMPTLGPVQPAHRNLCMHQSRKNNSLGACRAAVGQQHGAPGQGFSASFQRGENIWGLSGGWVACDRATHSPTHVEKIAQHLSFSCLQVCGGPATWGAWAGVFCFIPEG